MSTRNVISIAFSSEQRQEIKETLDKLAALMDPQLMALTPEQRRTIQTMGDRREPFVAKVIDYTGRNPEFVPAYMDVPELRRDYEAVKQMTPYLRKLQQLASKLDDTLFMCGAEAYAASRQYYQSVKMAMDQNVPGAKTVYEDLRRQFESMGRRLSSGEGDPHTPEETVI